MIEIKEVIENVTWIVPGSINDLENQYSNIIADVVAKMLNKDELKYLIDKLEEQE